MYSLIFLVPSENELGMVPIGTVSWCVEYRRIEWPGKNVHIARRASRSIPDIFGNHHLQ